MAQQQTSMPRQTGSLRRLIGKGRQPHIRDDALSPYLAIFGRRPFRPRLNPIDQQHITGGQLGSQSSSKTNTQHTLQPLVQHEPLQGRDSPCLSHATTHERHSVRPNPPPPESTNLGHDLLLVLAQTTAHQACLQLHGRNHRPTRSIQGHMPSRHELVNDNAPRP